MIIINFWNIRDRGKEDIKAYELKARYYVELSEALADFNKETGYKVEKLYNMYGQDLPLSYHVQNSGLDVWYMPSE